MLGPARKEAIKKADQLSDQAYELKGQGDHAGTLRLLEQAGDILERTLGKQSPEVASNLDDLATVHMRLGDYSKARALFQNALRILKTPSPEYVRLKEGIQRRLETIKALERNKIVCAEPMAPPIADDAGTGNKLPYFPPRKSMQDFFAKLQSEIDICPLDQPRHVTARMVVTGTGKVVLTQALLPEKLSNIARCLESALMKAAKRFENQTPKFSACFRNFTYPFALTPKPPR